MKVGDNVKILQIKGGYEFAKSLTIGNLYQIIKVYGDGVEIKDDEGGVHFLSDKDVRLEAITDQQPEPIDKGEKYQREISPGVFVDIYDVLEAWGVSCPARQHAIKKLLAAGQRGHKSEIKDLQEAHNSVGKAVKFQIRREEKSNGQSLSDSIAD